MFRWWHLLCLAWGVAIGLSAGILAITPPATTRATTPGPGQTASAETGGSALRSEVAASLVTPLASAVLTRPSVVQATTPVGEEPRGTDALTQPEAPDVASPAAPDGAADVAEPGPLEIDSVVAAEVEVLPGDSDPEQREGTQETRAEPADLTPLPPPVITGTIRDPLRATGWVLRAAPSTSARSLVSLPRGTRVQILPDTAGSGGMNWLHVRTQAGAVGWVVAEAVLR
jgi:hypothetical protein